MSPDNLVGANSPGVYVSIYPVDPMPPDIAALRTAHQPIWIFAYGSLMWNPEFDFAERRPAYLRGFHRSFCLYSRDYRGTPEQPGLVLGLDRGGSCHGIAYRLPPAVQAETLDRIWAREMTGMVYTMRRVTVTTGEGPLVAHACIVRRQSDDYAGRLTAEQMAALLARARGGRGTGRDYLANTVAHLDEMGIRDALLHRVAALVWQIGPTEPQAR